MAGHPEAVPDAALALVFGSDAEHSFFSRDGGNLFGGARCLVEPQRPLATMLASELVERTASLRDQKVDFALESPLESTEGTRARLVVEIDGGQHLKAGQARYDSGRTATLERSGWRVVRIPTGELSSIPQQSLDALTSVLEEDGFLRRTRDAGVVDLLASVAGREFARSLWTPHAVARTHLAILLGLMNGRLHLEQPVWRMAVVEREVPCADLAVLDLLATVMHLGTLYGIRVDPRVELNVAPMHLASFQRPELAVFGDDLRARVAVSDSDADRSTGARLGSIDVCVDVSVTATATQRFEPNAALSRILDVSAAAALVRTALRVPIKTLERRVRGRMA